MKIVLGLLIVFLTVFAFGCDIELGHTDHDHDGDGIQDHSAEEHNDEEHDEENQDDGHEDEEHNDG